MMLTYPLLFGVSFLGTKFVGLDDTLRLFARVGRYQKRLRGRGRRESIDSLERRIRKGYSYLPLPIQCMEQALVTWYLLNLHDHAARLKIGLSLTPLRSHAWVEASERVFGDVPGLADLQVVAEYQPW